MFKIFRFLTYFNSAFKMMNFNLASGQKMPMLGLGTFLATDEQEITTAVDDALKAGYRHIDTAYLYQNEKFIGKVLKEWLDSGRLKREDLFIVTKLPFIGVRPESVDYFMKKSLEALQLDYVDLYLIHSPIGLQHVSDTDLWPMKDGEILYDMNTDLVATWRAMEKQVDEGRAKSIGVSNFDENQVDRIAKIARIPISNNQVECQIYNQQKTLREVCKKHNITLCAYGPFGSPGRKVMYEKRGVKFEDPGVLGDPVVAELAKKYNKKPSQVLIRFLLQEGIAVIPKSCNPERLRDNFNVFDFELDSTDMDRLRALDKGDEGRFFTMAVFKGVEKHPECPNFVKKLMQKK